MNDLERNQLRALLSLALIDRLFVYDGRPVVVKGIEHDLRVAVLYDGPRKSEGLFFVEASSLGRY